MCFSPEASFGAAIALLPAGAYCVEAAWRKDPRYLALAVVPIVFGLQQLCEGVVWLGIGRQQPDVARVAALVYLGFALAVWPVWVPLATAIVEPRGASRHVFLLLGGMGLIFGFVNYLPLAIERGRELNPAVVGHSIRYDLSAPVIQSFWWWAWLACYLLTVSLPLLASRNHRLRPLGAGVLAFAVVSYLLFEHAFASVWCYFAAIVSVYMIFMLRQAPGQKTENLESHLHPMPSN